MNRMMLRAFIHFMRRFIDDVEAGKRKTLPPIKEGWKTGNMLQKERGGQNRAYIRRFKELRERKLAEGLTAEEVQNNWVGIYFNKIEREALCTSPQALEVIFSEKAPVIKDNWVSGSMLYRERGGNILRYISKFEELSNKKLAEGLTKEQVEDNWVSVSFKSGKNALYASPDAIAELEAQGIIRKAPSKGGQDGNNNEAKASLKATRPQPRKPHTKKDTIPSSEHLKRTGRVRGAEGED